MPSLKSSRAATGLFLQPGWCQFSATALTRRSPWQITVVPSSRPPSCCFGDYHLLSVTCPDISQETHQQHQEQATLLVRAAISHGSANIIISSNWNRSCAALCFVFPLLTVFFFIFHNDANKLKGSKCTLRQISLSLSLCYRQTSLQQPTKEPMKLWCTLILNSFS